jgi:HEAT repeat protein
VPDDPATPASDAVATTPRSEGGAPARLLEVVAAGHRGDAAGARRALSDADPAVRAAALGAMARAGDLAVADVVHGLADGSAVVRRRAAAEAVGVRGRGSRSVLPDALRKALRDRDALVAESACWALGELRVRSVVPDLTVMAADHPDPRCREAAVAALGAVGDHAGLAAVLAALGDKPAVRRRAAVALAGFDGPEVEEALRRCLDDRDWQVRQAAEILLAT